MARAPDGSFALAVSGTGTSAMEAAVANLVQPGTRVLAVVTGYFGDRLAEMCRRYGADVRRVDVEWGRACDPDAVRRALAESPADLVTVVHAETSTGVLNPVADVAAIAHEHGALIVVDAVTSLGAMPLDDGRLGPRCGLRLQPEGPGRAVRGRAARVRPAGARPARPVPELLPSTCAARGLLDASASITTPCAHR